MRVLIVEDDKISAKIMKKMLSQFGQCDLVTDGVEGLKFFLQGHTQGDEYTLICLDIMMPRLDGLRMLKAVREYEDEQCVPEEKRVRIIMTTALNDKKTIETAQELKCDGYLWKPIGMEALHTVIKNLKLIE